MKKKIVILGSGGMLGHVLSIYLKEKNEFEIITFSKKDFDFSKNFEIENLCYFLEHKDINFIINCAGILIKDANDNLELARKVNTELPKKLEKYFENSFTKIIHVSTDCVYTGKNKKDSYTEKDIPNETTNYGVTKYLGEILNKKDLTIRTSIIGQEISDHNTGLFHWFMNQKDSCSGYCNYYWNGLSTFQLSKLIYLIITEKYKLTGLKHFYTPEKIISKYDLLFLINKVFDRNIKIQPIIQKEEINKSLRNEFIQLGILNNVPYYERQLNEVKDFMLNHKELYEKNYKDLF
jgi:dTDP-4-dehydrorhamnose reductase